MGCRVAELPFGKNFIFGLALKRSDQSSRGSGIARQRTVVQKRRQLIFAAEEAPSRAPFIGETIRCCIGASSLARSRAAPLYRVLWHQPSQSEKFTGSAFF